MNTLTKTILDHYGEQSIDSLYQNSQFKSDMMDSVVPAFNIETGEYVGDFEPDYRSGPERSVVEIVLFS
jgi:hypothetical protein